MSSVGRQAAAAVFAPLVFGQLLVMTSPTFVARDKCPENLDALNCHYFMGGFEGIYASIINIGALLGCTFGPKILTSRGYRQTLLLINLLFGLGCIAHLAIPAPSSADDNTAVMFGLLAVRLVMGLGAGGCCAAVPSFLTTIAPVEKRGAFGSLFQIFVVVGVFMECLLGMFFGWRPLMLIALGTSVAGAVLSVLLIPRTDSTPQDGAVGVPEQLAQTSSARSLVAEPSSLAKVLRNPATRKPFLISTAVLVAQQASGVNALMFFMGTIFQEIFGDQETANMVAAGVQLCQLAVTLFSPLLVERLGRRPILLYGFAALGVRPAWTRLTSIFSHDCAKKLHRLIAARTSPPQVCMALLGATMLFELPGPVAVAAVFLYVAVFSCGVGGIPWFLVDELNAAESAPAAKAVGQTLNWGFSFIVVLTVEPLQQLLGDGGVFLLYAVNLAACTGIVYAFVPETKGKTIGEISAEINASSPTNNLRGSPSVLFEDPDAEMQNGDLFVLKVRLTVLAQFFVTRPGALKRKALQKTHCRSHLGLTRVHITVLKDGKIKKVSSKTDLLAEFAAEGPGPPGAVKRPSRFPQ